MITPMRHTTLICRAEDASGLLETLREFGGLHLHLHRRDNHGIEVLEEEVKEIEQIVQRLERVEDPVENAGTLPMEEWIPRLQRLEQAGKRLQVLEQKIAREQKAWAPFGEIKPATLRALRASGLRVDFIRSPKPAEDLPDGAVWLLAVEGYGVRIAPASDDSVPEAVLTLPVRGPERLRECEVSLNRLKQGQADDLSAAAARLPEFRALATEKRDELEFLKASAGMGDDESLRWIEGFLPADRLESIQELARSQGAALHVREPGEDDPTPTLLQHNNFVSWIQPVFNFLGVTPGYREVDVGWSFLIFLAVFSGMIIGDAGYGLLLLLGVGGLNLFKPASRGQFANLLLLMGGATVGWGVLTGNLFGLEGIPAVFPALSSTSDPRHIMNVCFVLGALHLTLAHLWNLFRKIRTPQALAELGWIGSTWTMYGISGQMVLGWDHMPGFLIPVFVISVALIVLFMTPPAELKEQWVDHMMLPLTFVNNFVDVVSYVRLYAVGMATFALASSFNAMILDGQSERGILAGAVMLIILVLGHTLNFILAGMGVMVHGIRLNTLEFASHLGLTWSGIPYKPFKKSELSTGSD